MLDYERFRLREQEVPFDVLNEVLHTSKQYGDGAGYDILSKFDFSGRTLYIEVKTTKGDLNTPFFISINELSFLEEYQDCALIYRVYNFDYFSNTGEIELITYDQLMSDFYIDEITFKVSPRFHY
ncbi:MULTISPECIES: DUF3883 domain-containing protein [Erysipelothrix]|uniref:DUF3883 domain-containing protein n=1 Tax=Erysipelothrix TaxID=1647 RepID=UPI00140D3EAF|nr:DUF3883 domain-containing protein [Erysipelothrix rhusiopathiae]MDV7678473.1 DUF3883 domain-containing protein [Erysipelothrix rhusiopathiae]WMT70173.1 DUF3883 domain-containing protein [Erysipelothrix rhusiopathiae]